MSTTILDSSFWEIFGKNIDELCNQYNLIKNNCYEMYNISNDKYVIIIDEYSHPQFEEIELSIKITNKNNNGVKYENTYILFGDWNGINITLPKPINEFINEIISIVKEQLDV